MSKGEMVSESVYMRERVKTKREIAQNQQFLSFAIMFSAFFSDYTYIYIEIFYIFAQMFSKLTAADLLYLGKGKVNELHRKTSVPMEGLNCLRTIVSLPFYWCSRDRERQMSNFGSPKGEISLFPLHFLLYMYVGNINP